jgi:hypothetical protein
VTHSRFRCAGSGEAAAASLPDLRKSTYASRSFTDGGLTLVIMPTSPGALADTLTSVWRRTVAHLPELPDAHIAVVTTAPPADHGPERWSLIGGVLQGLVVPVEILRAGPEEVITYLLHEAAHVANWRRETRDTTTRGYYHNEAFVSTATEVGLVWPEGLERDQGRGYDGVVLSDDARQRHANCMATLAEVIPPSLEGMSAPRSGAKRAQRPSFQCACTPPRRIWAAPSTVDLGEIVCGVCGKPFT